MATKELASRISNAPQSRLMIGIRGRLGRAISDLELRHLLSEATPYQEYWGIALVLYQSSNNRLMIVRTSDEPFRALTEVMRACESHPRFKDFAINDSMTCAIQIDFILRKPEPFDLSEASDSSLSPDKRFEIGVDGLRMVYENEVRYVLPGDGYIKSLLGVQQLKSYVARNFPKAKDISEIECKRFRSISYIDYVVRTSFLYRGYPTDERLLNPLFQSPIHRELFANVRDAEVLDSSVPPSPFSAPSASTLLDATDASIRWLVNHQRDDGSFLYYYDAASDSSRDHEHPKRDPASNPYYNLLRHCGATVTLILYYRLARLAEKCRLADNCYGETSKCISEHDFVAMERIAEIARKGCEFFCKQLVHYKIGVDESAAYPYYNRKGKLGGAGLGLFMLSLFSREIEVCFHEEREAIYRHILASICPTGEFRYYHVYLDKLVTWEENQLYFSFYYPGEAIIGLASHHWFLESVSDYAREKIGAALRFLLHERPLVHQQHYQSLPSDSWLMMAINELADQTGFLQDDYRAFVFSDAEKMMQHQYTERDAIFPDYLGSFYYKYGDHPYPDGARAEGLFAAYELATKMKARDDAKDFLRGVDRIAWSTMRLCNTPNSIYSAKNPSESLGGIRFKFTRQWFRIDTIQHVASFYLKLLYIHAQRELTSTTETLTD